MKNKNILVITGGEGFIGSSLIKYLIYKTNYKIISIDNGYSKKNLRIDSYRVRYIKDSSKNIFSLLKNYKNSINCIFHFGEFSRIVPSFKYRNDCFDSNLVSTLKVISFCSDNKIRLIYSASSSIFGNYGLDQNLSPYSWTKAKNIELIKNYSKWFSLKYEIAYFYNVYGPDQIGKGKMASVVGIFENQYLNNKNLTIVKPGNQKRDFTHIDDIINGVYLIWKKGKQKEYLLKYNKSYSIKQLAKFFKHKFIFVKERPGERFKSNMIKNDNAKKILGFEAKIDIKDYIKEFLNFHK